MATIYSTWCACAPGLEKLLAVELTALGLKPKEIEPGGMIAAMSAAQLYAANLHTSVAGRISVRLGRFHASEFWELEKRAERLALHAWLPKGSTIGFRVTSRKSKLYHQDAIAERLGALIAAKVPGVSVATADGDDDEPQDSRPTTHDQLFLVRLVNDEVTISVDSSGELLYRRGWRQETAKAPLRETLAAAMLTASGWTGATPLHDVAHRMRRHLKNVAVYHSVIPPADAKYLNAMVNRPPDNRPDAGVHDGAGRTVGPQVAAHQMHSIVKPRRHVGGQVGKGDHGLEPGRQTMAQRGVHLHPVFAQDQGHRPLGQGGATSCYKGVE